MLTRSGPLVFLPDRKRIAPGVDDYVVQLWDIESGAAILTLRGHASWIAVTAISADGK
ncbi:hypothetical protein M433DRAFT_149535 [Acidomyces richmondensis BFW]|nr:MAG: hypothetical protein FE78DRAFT_90210 [Acidomyces sp. 'richmondensis']KYG49873.1 hypothetical protein M433DRAFT_149535 [Acidomyces richmondensis BFW]